MPAANLPSPEITSWGFSLLSFKRRSLAENSTHLG